jgi:hypothetical protein
MRDHRIAELRVRIKDVLLASESTAGYDAALKIVL